MVEGTTLKASNAEVHPSFLKNVAILENPGDSAAASLAPGVRLRREPSFAQGGCGLDLTGFGRCSGLRHAASPQAHILRL